MHKEQHRQHHLKSNNIISKLAVIVLSVVLLTGISLVPTLQIGVNGQVQQQQPPQQQKQVGLSQVIKQIAEQVATANPGTSATHVQQILVQLAKQTAQTASKDQAIQKIRQISSQVAKFPFGTVSQSLAHFAQQVASGNSNVVQIVQQTVQEKASSGGGAGGSSKNIIQTLSNTAVQQATGGSKNVNQVIRQAAQILANRAGVPVEYVGAVIIQMALQISQAQGKSITAQFIFQIANQIIQNPNGVLGQAILNLVNQDDGGKSSHTTTVIKNYVKNSISIKERGRDPDPDPDPCKKTPKPAGCTPPPPPPPCNPGTQTCPPPPEELPPEELPPEELPPEELPPEELPPIDGGEEEEADGGEEGEGEEEADGGEEGEGEEEADGGEEGEADGGDDGGDDGGGDDDGGGRDDGGGDGGDGGDDGGGGEE